MAQAWPHTPHPDSLGSSISSPLLQHHQPPTLIQTPDSQSSCLTFGMQEGLVTELLFSLSPLQISKSTGVLVPSIKWCRNLHHAEVLATTCHARIPYKCWFVFQLLYFESSALLQWLGWQQMLAKSLTFLLAMWEIWMEFQDSGLALAQPDFSTIVEWICRWKMSFCLGKHLMVNIPMPFLLCRAGLNPAHTEPKEPSAHLPMTVRLSSFPFPSTEWSPDERVQTIEGTGTESISIHSLLEEISGMVIFGS